MSIIDYARTPFIYQVIQSDQAYVRLAYID
jgi:hypothetical protein